ncbi:MAG: hypothetical protein QX199_09065 [Methylococcaceae bacterium]
MIPVDFDLSERRSLNAVRELAGRRGPDSKIVSPLNVLLNRLQIPKGQEGIAALPLDCAASHHAVIQEYQERKIP